MSQIYKDAILMAGKIRRKAGIGMFEHVNIFDICAKMDVTVRFVDVSMEGLYLNQGNNPTILLSNQRPFPRRCFTCAHELGHHVFGHGHKLDVLEGKNKSAPKENNEILVDAFASALLMPVGAIQSQFAKREWKIEEASPVEFYTVASVFGVGFETLVRNCHANGLISDSKASSLLKTTPAKIFKAEFSEVGPASYFRIIDEFAGLSVIDLETSNYIVVPPDTIIEGGGLEKIQYSHRGHVYIAREPGIFTAHSAEKQNSYFVRVQRENYIGLADYRHLEN